MGEWDLSQENDCDPDDDTNCCDSPIDIGIDSITVHEDYSSSVKENLNDIALIRLATTVNFTRKLIIFKKCSYLCNLYS